MTAERVKDAAKPWIGPMVTIALAAISAYGMSYKAVVDALADHERAISDNAQQIAVESATRESEIRRVDGDNTRQDRQIERLQEARR